MTARLHTTSTSSTRELIISASISGFILDLDSTITSYVFSLVDVYRHGKNRVERLAAAIARNNPDQRTNLRVGTLAAASAPKSPATNVMASLTFLSGKVRVQKGASRSQSRDPKGRVFSFSRRREDQMLESDADVFNLPEVSVWCEYRTSPTIRKLVPQEVPDPSVLIFKSTIHSSENTLRPSLLPFLAEIVRDIEARMSTLR